MLDNKNIPVQIILIVFGTLIIAVSVIKLFLIHVTLNSSFYIAEFLTYGIILSTVYYLDYQIMASNKKVKKYADEIELIKKEFGSRESELLLKILKLEERENEELQYTVNREKTVAKIFQNIEKNTDNHELANQLLVSLSKSFEIVAGIFYLQTTSGGPYQPIGRYAISQDENIPPFIKNEGFCGQSVADQKILTITNVPEDYINIQSGLGGHAPVNLYFIPVVNDKKSIGLIEIATFRHIEIARIWSEINNKLIDLLKIR